MIKFIFRVLSINLLKWVTKSPRGRARRLYRHAKMQMTHPGVKLIYYTESKVTYFPLFCTNNKALSSLCLGTWCWCGTIQDSVYQIIYK